MRNRGSERVANGETPRNNETVRYTRAKHIETDKPREAQRENIHIERERERKRASKQASEQTSERASERGRASAGERRREGD